MRFTKKELIELIENEVPDGNIELVHDELGFTEKHKVYETTIQKALPVKKVGTYSLSLTVTWEGYALC